MTQDLINKNKLIAEFMEMKLSQTDHEEGTDFDWSNCPKNKHWPFRDPPPFHTSFDWLMPVWFAFKGMQFTGKNKLRHYEFIENVSRAIINDDIEIFFNKMAEGIEWLNGIKIHIRFSHHR